MVRSTLIPPRHRIRVQVMLWTSVLLFIAMVVPLEFRLNVDRQYLVLDLTDRSREVLNDVAAELGSMEFPEEDVDDVQALVLTEKTRVPSIVELSVFQKTPAGTKLIASTVKPPDVTPERLGNAGAQPITLKGSNGEHLMAMSRGAPNQPGVTIIAVTNEEELDRFNFISRRTGYIFTLGGIA